MLGRARNRAGAVHFVGRRTPSGLLAHQHCLPPAQRSRQGGALDRPVVARQRPSPGPGDEIAPHRPAPGARRPRRGPARRSRRARWRPRCRVVGGGRRRCRRWDPPPTGARRPATRPGRSLRRGRPSRGTPRAGSAGSPPRRQHRCRRGRRRPAGHQGGGTLPGGAPGLARRGHRYPERIGEAVAHGWRR